MVTSLYRDCNFVYCILLTATGGGTGFAVDWTTAMKYTKYANSSLTYEDREAAIEYLQKALNILTTGHE